MAKIQPSKDTVYYRHGAWGTMRLNTFDYRLIEAGYFSNEIFVAAKLMRCSHAYGRELPNMARLQIVPMYSMEQEKDGAFVKTYIRKSNNVHCLVMDKNAVDELLNITCETVKKHSVIAYVPRMEATVSVQDKKKNDSYEVRNIFPTSTVVALRQEREIFVLLNGRRLEKNVGIPSTLDILEPAKTTVINLDREQRSTVVRLCQLGEKELLLRDDKDEDVDATLISVTAMRVVDTPVTVVGQNIVVESSESSSNAPVTVIRKVKPGQVRKNAVSDSDSDEWIDITESKASYAAQRKTVRSVRTKRKLEKENEHPIPPNPKCHRTAGLERGKNRLRGSTNIIEVTLSASIQHRWLGGRTKLILSKSVLFNSESDKQNRKRSGKTDSVPRSGLLKELNIPVCREIGLNWSTRFSDRFPEVPEHREKAEEEKFVCCAFWSVHGAPSTRKITLENENQART